MLFNLLISMFFLSTPLLAAGWELNPVTTAGSIGRIPYSTVRVEGALQGTGFFYLDYEEEGDLVVRFDGRSPPSPHFSKIVDTRLSIQSGDSQLYVVTNDHVIRGRERRASPDSIKIFLNFKTRDNRVTPHLLDINDAQIATLIGEQKIKFSARPEVDLAVINVTDIIKEMENDDRGELLYFAFTEQTFQPLGEVELYEDVAMIGYPNGLYDTAHNLPILRGGKTASIPSRPWQHKPEFLIDCASIPGSSGSPVLLIKTTFEVGTTVEDLDYVESITHTDRGLIESVVDETQKVVTEVDEKVTPIKMISLLGVLWGLSEFDVDGRIIVNDVPVPTASELAARTRIPINLGHVVHASEIKRLIRQVDGGASVAGAAGAASADGS